MCNIKKNRVSQKKRGVKNCFIIIITERSFIIPETFLNECHRRAQELSSEYLTQCDEDGFFKTTQCTDDECFCVKKLSGEELQGTRAHKSVFDLKCSFLGGDMIC